MSWKPTVKGRRYVSYANVTATLALVFSMSGGALAASHYLIDSTKQINPKVLKSLRGKMGETGRTGLQGPQGSQGSQGAQGLQGAQGAKGEKGSEGEKGPEGNPASIPALSAVTPFAGSNFGPGWSNYGTIESPGYYKDALGIVHLTGTVKASSSSYVPGYIIQVSQLPTGYRADGFFPAGSSEAGGASAACTLEIGGGGIYALPGCDYREISLEGITYRPAE
jgi:Collagen triple helix repeat (20 copies)